MDIIFLLSHKPDPRMNKRLQISKDAFETALIFWNRGTVDIWDIYHSDIKNFEINIKANYINPLKRIIPTIRFGYQAYREIKKLNPKCLYVSNIDMLFIAVFYVLKESKYDVQIVYEIADLNKLIIDDQKTTTKKIAQLILKNIEKRLCRYINTLIITSERFYQDYYVDFISKSKVLFMPNMPKVEVFKNYSKKTSGKFTIGFIGAIRYKKQMKMLIEAAEKADVNVFFAGAGLDDEIEKLSKHKPHVKYIGKYNYEKEVAYLYGQVDCIFAVYDANLYNVRIALPNKLYEAIYCELPIIVSKGTYLADLVNKMGVGVAVNHDNLEDLVNELTKLSKDKNYLYQFVNNCRKNKTLIKNDNYNNKLRRVLKNNIDRSNGQATMN